MVRHIFTAAILATALAGGVLACADANPAGPVDTNVPVPRPSGPVPSPAPLTMIASNVVASVAYLSVAPGTFRDDGTVAVHNKTKAGAPQEVQIVDGGFDPVAVAAETGDELYVVLGVPGGAQTTIAITVPARRAPAVVRTWPTRSQVDVRLTDDMLIVFSEPVDRSSVTTSSVLLVGDTEVSGTVEVSSDGLSAAFNPSAALEFETIYSLAINEGIRDLDGDALAGTSTVAFRTRATTPPGAIVFVRPSDGQIYRAALDGSGLTQLTSTGRNANPFWSPDGSRIAFARNTPGEANQGQGTTDIYLMDADGSNAVRRTVNSGFWMAAWSPDGRQLAVSDEGIYYAELRIMSVVDDGSAPRLLAVNARSPAWSPDGTQIAYVQTSGDDGYHQVYVINADGSGARALTENDGGGIYGLAWSPNGSRIAFSKCVAGGCGVYVMAADGSALSRIYNGGAQGTAWSPDGTLIAFTWSPEGTWQPDIAYIPADGGVARAVISGGFSASWRP